MRILIIWSLLVPASRIAFAEDCQRTRQAPTSMVWISAGDFEMGSDGMEGRFDERPAHCVFVDGFWIDVTEVTNAEFKKFVDATGYVTTAERKPDWDVIKKQLPPGTPKPADEDLVPGGLVFVSPEHRVDRRDFARWWRWVPGASWRQPQGPGSSITGKDHYPVVQISWDDATAFANWAGKRLPTEAEWERAARYENDRARYTWGDEHEPAGKHMANIWQGPFPYRDTGADGHAGVAPVKSFPPNGAGLYDMAGNVWEWTQDRYHRDAYAQRTRESDKRSCCKNPKGPSRSVDPRNPHAADSRVQKGGSYLCHMSYCESYRPSAKTSATPDTGANHLGFRCVSDAPPPQVEASRR